MHPSERVMKTLSHQEPDRVPMMFSGSRWVIERLKKHLGGMEPGVGSDRDLMRALGMDIWDTRGFDYSSGVGAKYVGPRDIKGSDNYGGNLFCFFNYYEDLTENEYGPAYGMGKPSFDEEKFPGIEELEKFPWPQRDWFDFSNVREQLEPWADEFAIAATGCSVFQHPTLYRGIEQLMFELEGEPEIAQYIVTKVTDSYLAYYEGLFEEAGDLIQIFRLADDIGAQNTLFISPDNLSDFIKPHLKRCADLARKHDIKLMFHTDGNVRECIPELIEWGVDMLDPIQPEVPDMETKDLKDAYGANLCFSGGVGSQEILPRGTVDEVKAEVKRVLDIMKPGGGYILSPGHPSLQMDIPPANIAAMFEAGREYGAY